MLPKSSTGAMNGSNLTKRLKTEGGASEQTIEALSVGKSNSSCSAKPTARATENPLENSVILHHLFNLCPVEVLTKCRLVCMQWYRDSLLTWRTNCPITLTRDTENRDQLVSINYEEIKQKLGWKSAAHLRLHNLLPYCKNPSNECFTKPFRSIKMMSSSQHLQYDVFPNQYPNLWNTLGNNLTTLHLFRCVFDGLDDYRKLIFTTCPNLQTLKLDHCMMYMDKGLHLELATIFDEKQSPKYKEPHHERKLHLKTLEISCQNPEFGLIMPWIEMFSLLQSLTHFSFEYNANDDFIDGEFTLLMEAMKSVRKHHPGAFPLKLVNIFPAPDISASNDISEREMGLVKELHLPLKSLKIQVQPDMDEDVVKTNLSFHAKTVRLLTVTRNTHAALLFEEFPFGVHLNQLTYMKIDKHLIKTLGFLNYTPNMKFLAIDGDRRTGIPSIANSREEEMLNVRMVHLEGLKLDAVVTDHDLACLFNWMPWVNILHGLTLNDQHFRIVCGNWKQLKSLSVRGDQLTDAGVTGIQKGRNRKKPEVVLPNITDLQMLEEFAYSDNTLTEASCFHGFLQLPKFREIKFWKEHTQSWGKHARMALEEKDVVFHETPCRQCPGNSKCDSAIHKRFKLF